MNAFRPDVQDYIHQHNLLLQQSRDIEYAPPALKQVEDQLSIVQARLQEDNKQLGQLKIATKKEYDEWITVRDGTSKRMITKILHPRSHETILSEKESKEEKEYLEALKVEKEIESDIALMHKESV